MQMKTWKNRFVYCFNLDEIGKDYWFFIIGVYRRSSLSNFNFSIWIQFQLHYERTEARRKLLKDQGKTQDEGENNKVSDRWKRVLGSALSSIEPKDDSKPQATSLLSRVVALNSM